MKTCNYAYKDKYIVTATLSLDGSSRVGDEADNTIKMFGAPFGLFYSGGLAWRLSSEEFLNDVSWLEDLNSGFLSGKPEMMTLANQVQAIITNPLNSGKPSDYILL